jgi:hypothetical protein
MSGFFVYFRCWPDFSDSFPFEKFNGLPDDDLQSALNEFAEDWLRKSKAEVRQSWLAKRQKRTQAIKQRASQFSNPPNGAPTTHGRRTTRRPRRRPPFFARVGRYAGWLRKIPIVFEDQIVGPKTWFYVAESRELTDLIVSTLANQRSLDYEDHDAEHLLNPRYGIVPADDYNTAEATAIRWSIDKLSAGVATVPYGKIAVEIGSLARKTAGELATTWASRPDEEQPDLSAARLDRPDGDQEITVPSPNDSDDFQLPPQWWYMSEGSSRRVAWNEHGQRVYDDAVWPQKGINDLADLLAYIDTALGQVEGLRVLSDTTAKIGLEHGKDVVRNARTWLFRHKFRGFPAEPPSVNELDSDSVESVLHKIITWIENKVDVTVIQSGEVVQLDAGDETEADATRFVATETTQRESPLPTKPKRRGRPKADDDTIKRESKLAEAWKRAREAGVYKPDFAKEQKMTLVKFGKLLGRVAARKSRSDK